VLGTLPGCLRPGIAVTMNFGGSPLTLLDMGALSQPKPENLVQHGIMGAAFAKCALGIETPRVGLLNIGEEASKGTDLLKAAHPLLAAAKVQFVGNVEGNEVFRNKCDVLVTDGFTGNVLLKFCEDFAAQMLHLVVGECAKAGVAIPREVLGRVQKRIDYSEYGGALLLGVGGIVFKGHGRSDHHAVSNALHAAQRALDARINEHIVTALAEVQTSATN
jgi:glycerol-3-phosphate acyltransferase PlsX